jgi:Lrp/AsnC family transcriptional regulator for asnA, asnC and gidA
MRHCIIDELDVSILNMIVKDARVPFLEVARACNVSGAAVHQRIHKLSEMGVLKGSKFIVDPDKMGYKTCAFIGVFLKDPEYSDEVVEALSKVPEIVECHYTTGKYDMFVKIYARDNHHLMRIIRDKLQGLGIARTETLISFHEGLHRQAPIVSTQEAEDEDEEMEKSGDIVSF